MLQNNVILIVDDDESIIAMLKLHLERAGYNVTSCNDAGQAVVKAKSLNPRLIISDLQMPNWGTGADAYEDIRNTPFLKETPVIFVTAMGHEDAEQMLRKRDRRTRLMHKPIDWPQLQAAVLELTGPAHPPGAGAPAKPAAPAAAAPPPAPKAPEAKAQPKPAHLRRMILLVDDDPHGVAMLQLHLEHAGFTVSHCNDAAQAVLQARGLRPWLVITDINMPGWGSGVDAHRGIREIPSLKETPVIFITAMERDAAQKMVPSDPRTRLVFKPVDFPKLRAAISELTGE
ncbi:MAG: response regulator [Elusimicrobia bacterium]|nr:response regulator [Elusimicrobiota bacterium]